MVKFSVKTSLEARTSCLALAISNTLYVARSLFLIKPCSEIIPPSSSIAKMILTAWRILVRSSKKIFMPALLKCLNIRQLEHKVQTFQLLQLGEYLFLQFPVQTADKVRSLGVLVRFSVFTDILVRLSPCSVTSSLTLPVPTINNYVNRYRHYKYHSDLCIFFCTKLSVDARILFVSNRSTYLWDSFFYLFFIKNSFITVQIDNFF